MTENAQEALHNIYMMLALFPTGFTTVMFVMVSMNLSDKDLKFYNFFSTSTHVETFWRKCHCYFGSGQYFSIFGVLALCAGQAMQFHGQPKASIPSSKSANFR